MQKYKLGMTKDEFLIAAGRRHTPHYLVYQAIKYKVINRKHKCERCSYPHPHAHHPDYTKPLDVEWLRVSCHNQQDLWKHRRGPIVTDCNQRI